MSQAFENVIKFIQKTNDKCIVLDKNGDIAYVVLSYDEYQKLIENVSGVQNLTEDELLDKINRDIAIWKSAQDDEDLDVWDEINGIKSLRKDDESAVEPSNLAENEENLEKKADESSAMKSAKGRYYFEPID